MILREPLLYSTALMGADMTLMACAVVALSMLAGAAQAGDWRLSTVGRQAAIAVDISSVQVEGNRATAWIAVLMPVTRSGFDYALIRTEYLCDDLISFELVSIRYDATGREVSRSDVPSAAFAIDPSSNEKIARDAVCFGKFQMHDPEGWSDAVTLLRDYRTTPPA